MTTKTDVLGDAYKRLERIWHTPVIVTVVVVSVFTYFYQYSVASPNQDRYFFLAEVIKLAFPVIFGINALFKYKSSKLKSWISFFIACIIWLIAQSLELLSQLSPGFRSSYLPYREFVFYAIFPFVIVGIIGIGLHSYSKISKARVMFDSLMLGSSVGFFICSALLLINPNNVDLANKIVFIFFDIVIASLAITIILFRKADRVVLPLAAALIFNIISEVLKVLIDSKSSIFANPFVEIFALFAAISFTYTFQSKDAFPNKSVTMRGEDHIKNAIFAWVFACLAYSSVAYSIDPLILTQLWYIFGCMFAAMLATQVFTHYEHRHLLAQREKALYSMTSSEEKFRIAFENGPTTLVLLDEEGKVLRANRAFFNFTAFEESEIIGSALSYIIHPDERAIFDVNLATILSQLSSESINVECRFLQKDGGIRWGSASISHIPLTLLSDEETAEFVVQIEDITDQKVHENELKSLSVKDPLTGLWNRTHMFDLIDEIIDRTPASGDTALSLTFAVMFLDLDRFKIINDTLGHGAGDVVINITSERITSIVGSRGEVARIGGDEFVVLLSPPVTETVASLIAQEIKETLCQPILLSQGETIITCSIGVVMCSGKGLSAQNILREADAAMYRAKGHGKNSIEISASKDRQRISTELKFSNDLHRALNTQQIKVFYQPIVSLSNNEIIGFEALSRWIHPKKGIISPEEFIPLAEDTGLILDIGYYMMEEAFRQLGVWQNDYVTSTGRPLAMNVNLSTTQLRDPKLLREIERVKTQSDCLANTMAFEITESAVLGDPKGAIILLNDIRDLGFRLRVDDFGTGYSSLAYLKKLPIDGFKIDKSFVNGLDIDEDDTAIIHALLGLAHAMHLTVTAEGIEQDSQRIALKELGCDYGQGYLFSEAVQPEDVVLPARDEKLSPKVHKRGA